MLGTSLLFRLDGRPKHRVVPYFDWGAGFLHTTLATRAPELSGNLQFIPQAGVGIQYFVRQSSPARLAESISRFVTPLIADTTTTTRMPFALEATICAARAMQVASPTDVPPNFIT